MPGAVAEDLGSPGGVEAATSPVPPRTVRFLRRSADGASWEEQAVSEGVFHSSAIPGLAFDLEAYWRECQL